MLTPVIILNNSLAKWGEVPVPRCHVDLAWIGLRVSDELGDCRCWHRWIDHYDKGRAHHPCKGCDVAEKNEIELVVERRADCIRRSNLQERVAVRWCLHNRFGGDIAAGTGPVLDDERLAEPL